MLARRAADAAGRHARGRRRRRGGRGARGARADGRVRRPGAQRGVDRRHGRAHPHRRQHRDRRLRPRAGDGRTRRCWTSRNATIDVPVRVQRRRRRHRRGHPRPRPGDARCSSSRRRRSRTIETLTNARSAREWLVAALGEDARRAPLRRGVHERREGGGVRHRPREHVRVLGLGRRPVLDGLGDRPVADDRDRSRRRSREMLAGFHDDRRALPHRAVRAEPAGAAGRCWASGTATSWAPQTKAILPYSHHLSKLAGLPPAARHGVQRQVGRRSTATRSATTPVRSCGARRARTASTRTTSCSTRARRSCRPTSSGSPTPPIRSATTTTC